MGSMQAREMADAVHNSEVSLRAALRWHLSANHYPPVPGYMVPVAEQAIDHANAGEWHHDVDLPEQVTWRGQDHVPVHAVIEALHLHSFIDGVDEEDEVDW